MHATLSSDQISNVALRAYVEFGGPQGVEIKSVFHHRYEGGQCDWGFTDQYGTRWAWFGGDTESDAQGLNLFAEWSIDVIEGGAQ